MKALTRIVVVSAGVALALMTGNAILHLPAAAVHLPAQVNAALDSSGVTHPVTAVLLNYRGYDTLLEIAVLLLALLGIFVAKGETPIHPRLIAGQAQPLLQSLARLLVPLIIVIAGYLLWAGSSRPGGAFQAGAVLAAAAVLRYLAQLAPAWGDPGRWPRFGLVAGFLVFLCIATALLSQGALLQYPPAWAGVLILVIEAALTFSLGLILSGMIFWLPHEHEEDA